MFHLPVSVSQEFKKVLAGWFWLIGLSDSKYNWENVGGEELEQLGAGLPSFCHHEASRFLYVLSPHALAWASAQHGSFREVGLFTSWLRVMV